MQSAFSLSLRRMRAPLVVIVTVYAVSVFGLVLIPGTDPAASPRRR